MCRCVSRDAALVVGADVVSRVGLRRGAGSTAIYVWHDGAAERRSLSGERARGAGPLGCLVVVDVTDVAAIIVISVIVTGPSVRCCTSI